MNHDPKRPSDRPDAFLEARDPIERSALSGDGIESALDEIGAEITTRSRQASSRWPRRISMSKPRAALVIGFATIGISAAVAGGSQLSAHTGIFASKKGETGEILNPAGGDFREVALQVASDVPWPDGYVSWRDSLISDEIRMAQGAQGAVESTGALHGWFAMRSFCAWVLDWRYAEKVGNSEAAAKAAQVISEAPTWKAVTDEDPHLDPAATGEDGKSIASLFGWMLPFRDAVLAGDRTHVEHLLITEDQGGRCQDYDWDWRALDSAHAREWSGTERQQKYAQYLASRTS